MLRMFQTHLKIPPPSSIPLFPAGTLASRSATLGTTSPNATASAWIDIYYPVLNTPREREVEILGPDGEAVWSANLEEEGDPLDEDAAKFHDAVPAFHGLSADGDVEGQLLYANHGKQEDYDLLISNGANFTDKIVLLRYGRVMRGLKARTSYTVQFES
jgi:N-acetylated-alpha-linked acidic dipeptidase